MEIDGHLGSCQRRCRCRPFALGKEECTVCNKVYSTPRNKKMRAFRFLSMSSIMSILDSKGRTLTFVKRSCTMIYLFSTEGFQVNFQNKNKNQVPTPESTTAKGDISPHAAVIL